MASALELPPTVFEKNAKQREALELLNNNVHSLLYGGARSGKTLIIIRNIVLRALKHPSRHLIIRLRFNHVKVAVWHDTFPKVMKLCFPGVKWHPNKTDYFVTIPTSDGKGESEIWFAGTDDPARVEKVLGNEYSTIFANEISQLKWDVILTMWTRLAENSGLALKFYYDCNPPPKRHWSYRMFFEAKTEDGEPLLMPSDPTDLNSPMVPLETASMLINPIDNPHLDPVYMGILRSLPERKRKRMLDGLFLDDVEGALWSDIRLIQARAKEYGELQQIVVAVDPSVSSTEDADECGIIVAGIDEKGTGVVLADHSDQLSPLKWALRVANLWEKWGANLVIAEVNQGGDLVRDAIQRVNPAIPVVMVHAKLGKYARAEPVSLLYEQENVAHESEFTALEEEMTTYVPLDAKFSPNRLDALVYALSYLMIGENETFHIGG